MNFGVINKRILPVFAAVTALLVSGVARAQEPNIQVTGATGEAGGDAVTINLSFNDTPAPSTSAFDFVLEFDAALLGTLDVTNCGGPTIGAFCNVSGNQVNVIRSAGTPPTAIGDGSVGSIELGIAGDAPIGTFPIQIQSENYFDLSGDNITPSPSGSAAGSIIVEEPVVGGAVLDFVPAGDGTNTVDAGEAEFGSAAPGADIDVTEAGTDDVVLDSCSISGTNAGDFSVSYSGADEPLPATFTGGSGQTGTITVDCTPSGRGERTAQLECSVEDAGMTETQTPSWPLTCAGLAPNVQVPAGPITFNGTVAGADPAATITLTNPDDGFTSTATNVAATEGAGATEVTLTVAGPFSIAPDGSADFEVSCDSSAEGTFTRTLDFTWDNPDPAGPTSGSVDATCTISDTAPIYESDPVPGTTIALSAPFGTQSAPDGLDVRNANPNTAADDLIINSATPSDTAVFSVTVNQSTFPANGTFDGSDDIEVTCTPKGVGVVNGTVTVDTNDPNQPAGGFEYPLSCEGTGEVLTSSPAAGGTLNLGTVPPGTQTNPGAITFTNNGIAGNGDVTVDCGVTDNSPSGDVFTFTPDAISFTLAEGASEDAELQCAPPDVASFTADVSCTLGGEASGTADFTVSCAGRPLVIPTMSRWGLIVMSLMLLLVGGFATRRMMA